MSTMTKKMTDAEIMKAYFSGDLRKDAVIEEFYIRYRNFVHKHWAILATQLQRSSLIESYKEDFYGEASIALIKTIDAIKEEKILNDKWKFLGYYGFYLKNTRISLLKKVLRLYKNETSLYKPGISEDKEVCVLDLQPSEALIHDVEDSFFLEMEKQACQKAVDYCVKNLWSKDMKVMWNMKDSDQSIKEVCKGLGIKYHSYRKKLKVMEDQIKTIALSLT